MQDRQLYEQILGIGKPWHVTEVELKLAEGEVHVYLGHGSAAAWPCPECGRDCSLYDHQPERKWRHLDTCQYRTVLHAELTRVIEGQETSGKDRIFGWFAEQIRGRNAGGDKPIIAVCDGDRALWEKVKALMQTVGLPILCVLDIFHVLERLWLAAHCFHPEGSKEAKAFVAQRLRRVLEGDVGYVIGGLKQMRTKHPLKNSKRQRLAEV